MSKSVSRSVLCGKGGMLGTQNTNTRTVSRSALCYENGVQTGLGPRKRFRGRPWSTKTESRSAPEHENGVQVGTWSTKTVSRPWATKTVSRSALGHCNSLPNSERRPFGFVPVTHPLSQRAFLWYSSHLGVDLFTTFVKKRAPGHRPLEAACQ